MANKKIKKQSVKSLNTNKSSKKAPVKSGTASKAASQKLNVKKKSAKPSAASAKPLSKTKSNEKPVNKKIESKSAKQTSNKDSSKISAKKETAAELAKTSKVNSIDQQKEQKESKASTAASAKKTKASKTQKPQKESTEMDDDFLSDDVEAIEDIGEYEEELKAVEEADEEAEDETAWDLENKENNEDEIILTDAEGRRYCRARDCDQISAVDAYCRYHYLLFWKKIQIRKKILVDGKLERYVEELTSRYPDKFLEMIRRDLRTTKDFLSAIQELEIDESASGDNDFEEESQTFIDEVRGLNDTPSMDEEEF